MTLARGTRKSIPPPGPTKSSVELAAEAAERANRALSSDKPDVAVLELKKAVELVPNNVDYNALLGWALFCAADDKTSVAAESRKMLEKAVYKSQQPEIARFYLGRVERILGRDKEALRHFHAVLDVLPSHSDASAEVRVIEARLKRLGRGKNSGATAATCVAQSTACSNEASWTLPLSGSVQTSRSPPRWMSPFI